MKYCSHCGAQIMDEAVICVHCGCSVAERQYEQVQTVPKEDNIIEVLIKVFMILGCVSLGWMIVPLAWCIPMTISVFRKLNNKEPISTGLKVCSLIFVNLIAGILLLCCDDLKL